MNENRDNTPVEENEGPTPHDLGAERPGIDDETYDSAVSLDNVKQALIANGMSEAEADAAIAEVVADGDVPETEDFIIDPNILSDPEPIDNPNRVQGQRMFGRNSKCPCGSGRKIKKCHPDLL